MAAFTFRPTRAPWIDRPARFHRGHGWEMNGVPIKVEKKHYHFIWPKDGRNGSRWGRVKDIFTGKGPDIHCTVGANKMDYMFHRPRKNHWSLHADLGPRDPSCSLPPWSEGIQDTREDSRLKYDFRTRRFVKPYHGMWTDARWPEEPWENTEEPVAWKDVYNIWWQNPIHFPPPRPYMF